MALTKGIGCFVAERNPKRTVDAGVKQGVAVREISSGKKIKGLEAVYGALSKVEKSGESGNLSRGVFVEV
jgi:hypothetical protein